MSDKIQKNSSRYGGYDFDSCTSVSESFNRRFSSFFWTNWGGFVCDSGFEVRMDYTAARPSAIGISLVAFSSVNGGSW